MNPLQRRLRNAPRHDPPPNRPPHDKNPRQRTRADEGKQPALHFMTPFLLDVQDVRSEIARDSDG
ncbi:hypothetical protein AB433_07635 [Croceicoccus naphthovorans]|uniref:Uncharacterized protein n=1 Tax=Croceicoccus naphthovorans TaxID=1348774 RepID=A0A0G3XGY6_9SPHN|nr:hypothetical protein AB433_07635 [Croceicoccus naphthovorans]